ncbi:MAG: hypothetical protein KC983_02405, partial [Phycisphaerales bacterium]|nr:hypothetical protein [Phycisphaerales bacterium]
MAISRLAPRHSHLCAAAVLLASAGAHAGIIGFNVTVVDFSNGFVFADGTVHAASAAVVPAARPEGTKTLRIWASVESATDTVQYLGSTTGAPFEVDEWIFCHAELFNESMFGTNIDAPNPALYSVFPAVAYDSWLTIGHDGSVATTGATNVGNDDGWLATWSAGQFFSTTVGALFDPSPSAGEDVVSDGHGGWRVLLAQLTVNEESFASISGAIGGNGQTFVGISGGPLGQRFAGCCLSDGTCLSVGVDSGVEECAALEGHFPDTQCCFETECPPIFGACCLPDGSCLQRTPMECKKAAGAYQGDFVSCRCPEDCAPLVNSFGGIGNKVVNIDDLTSVINAFGATESVCDVAPSNPGAPAGNNIVNID